MVLTLKGTAKPVYEYEFALPAVTICGSGFHMSNVEKKNADDFVDWWKAKNMFDTETHSSGLHYILSFSD